MELFLRRQGIRKLLMCLAMEQCLRLIYSMAQTGLLSGTINAVANTISFLITNTSANITAIDKFNLLKAKVLLQGPYNTATHLMSDNLRAAGVIPLTDPYSQAPYNTAFLRSKRPDCRNR